MVDIVWDAVVGSDPLIATAIHDGHNVRPELARLFALSDSDRLREEDPYTAGWAMAAETRIIGLRSRFEVDLNRPRDKAVYRTPEDAWGLNVWNAPLADDVVVRSVAEYDAFYREMHKILSGVAERYGSFVVYDLHSYNHRRGGPDGEPADTEKNPEVNIGTGTMDRKRWGPVVDRFIGDLQTFDFGGRRLDVRENVKFRGGQFSRWIHENFPGTGCSLAIEFKKFFMDEWTGKPDQQANALILAALQSTTPGVLQERKKLRS